MRPSTMLLLATAAIATHATHARGEPPIVQLHKDKGVVAHPGLDALYQRFSKAMSELDVDGAAGVYSDDAMYLIPGEDLRTGRTAIRESFARDFQMRRERGRHAFLRFGIVQRRVDGNQAYDVGYGNLSVSGKDGYYSQSFFKFVVVARRFGKDDGSWRWQVDSWSDLYPRGASSMNTERDLEKQVGSAVTLRGTARDAKGGAVLQLATGEPIYLRGLDAWPQALHGKSVQVSGVLKKEKYLPDPVTKDGAIAQGAVGMQWTLENPSFQPASGP